MKILDNLAISILAKPFVVLYGPSGTGKTQAAVKIAQKFDVYPQVSEWFEITVNNSSEIISSPGDSFRDMVNLNTEKNNIFIGKNSAGKRHEVAIEFCQNLDMTTEASEDLLPEAVNDLQISANRNLEISNYVVIPVSSNWHDSKPLIGYVNPFGAENQTVYEITPFLETLISANHPENVETPFFVILDEMNLSHVEHYLSDILSLMESVQYSPSEYLISPQKLEVIKRTLEFEAQSQAYSAYLLESVNNLIEMGKGLTIPSNFFLIGTINIDETTKMLSNKVLDRAYLIKFETESPSRILNSAEFVSLLTEEDFKTNFLSVMRSKSAFNFEENFQDIYDDLKVDENILVYEKENILEILDSIYASLDEVDQSFGYRVTKETFIYLIIGSLFIQSNVEQENLLNNVINQKVLVKISGNRQILNTLIDDLIKIFNENNLGVDFSQVIARLNNLKIRLNLRGQASFIS